MVEKSPGSPSTLHTVIVQTEQMEALAAFYGRGLELGDPLPTGPDHLGFQMPNVYFGFDLVKEAPQANGAVSLWFEVEDLKAVFRRFVDLGAKVKYPPTRKPWGALLTALYDLDNNLFGLSKREVESD